MAAIRDADSTATDDVSVALSAGIDVAIVRGDPNNIKVTLPEDFGRELRVDERRRRAVAGEDAVAGLAFQFVTFELICHKRAGLIKAASTH